MNIFHENVIAAAKDYAEKAFKDDERAAGIALDAYRKAKEIEDKAILAEAYSRAGFER
jgi:hypothetical protein